MNERIEQFARQCTEYITGTLDGNFEQFDYKKFAELLLQDYAKKKIQGLMRDPAFAKAMDEYYEEKWAHRFD